MRTFLASLLGALIFATSATADTKPVLVTGMEIFDGEEGFVHAIAEEVVIEEDGQIYVACVIHIETKPLNGQDTPPVDSGGYDKIRLYDNFYSEPELTRLIDPDTCWFKDKTLDHPHSSFEIVEGAGVELVKEIKYQ